MSGPRILRGLGGERRFFSRFAATGRRVREAGIATGRIVELGGHDELMASGGSHGRLYRAAHIDHG